jgi:hypothetical protein
LNEAGLPQTANKVAFSHRHNDDGTVDSICLKCYWTIATEETEADLADAEAAHDCGGFDAANTLRSGPPPRF